jgi:predicted RNA-binding Zn ribbon-like protein
VNSADLLIAFLNTSRSGDILATRDGLAAWAMEAGVLSPGVWIDAPAVDRLLALREGLRVLIRDGDSGALDTELERMAFGALAEADGTVRLIAARPGADQVAAAIVEALISAQTDRSWDRVKVCTGCDAAFVDGSRNRSRRWCDMGTCGSQAKMRAYRARHRQARNAGNV